MSLWQNTKFKEDSMTRVKISKARKLKKKDFNRTFIKKYCKFLGYTALAIVGIIAFIHLWIGAVNQHMDKVDAIRQGVVFDD
jgi:ATP-dependent Zn protease